VAATTLWRGSGTIDDQREVKFSEEDIGYVSGLDRTYVPKVLAALSLDDVEATFEQLPYILAAGVKNVVSGAADGTGSDKVYAYPFPTTSVNSIKTYTLEGGDNQQEEEVEYAFVEAFKLSGKPGEAVMMSADWRGRQVTASTKTGALAVPTVEEILFSKGKLYIDAVGGTLGTTQKSNTFLGMDLSVKTGWIPVFTADGNLYFSFHKSTMPEVTLDITFEHDGTATAEKANWRNQTARQIRLDFDGSAVTTPGTDFSTKKLRIDLAGKWEKFEKLDENDGNDIVKGTFRVRYNATAALFAEIKVVNELASLA
jgi:hypothetical protein